jgi:hypothetical protein
MLWSASPANEMLDQNSSLVRLARNPLNNSTAQTMLVNAHKT